MRDIPTKDVSRILKRIEALAEEPGAEGRIKLSARERYRVRQGLYRIVYEIREEVLIVHVVKS
ncbi:MAG: type II toxin-antitoxin system RelE/ParE family toxin [Pseudomonadales bacterium]|nr:type II toxin-antitoxin system RelE/ParE family toxin [Pseudomonadales bacterium]